jgi:Xaa-Pro aminopeptidase
VSELAALDVRSRLARLCDRLGEEGLEGLVVTSLVNVRYLTGFTGSAAILAVARDAAVICTDGRYRTQVVEELERAGVAEHIEAFVGRPDDQRARLAEWAAALGAGARLGLEAEHASHLRYQQLAELLAPREAVATVGLVEALRVVKDPGEQDRIARAAAIADEALARVRPLLARGPTEAELALELDAAMRRLGAEDRAFETIVAAGPNAAKPHHRPGPRRIERGDVVVVDFGACFDGYRSDMTRTFVVGGRTDPELERILELVASSQQAGVDAVAPGAPAATVDGACRDQIAAAGYGEAFDHGTGHGVGLEVHEAPVVGPRTDERLREGMVVTVEPGVYLPGRGGVRIEDTLVVTEEGARVVTRFPKDVAA